MSDTKVPADFEDRIRQALGERAAGLRTSVPALSRDPLPRPEPDRRVRLVMLGVAVAIPALAVGLWVGLGHSNSGTVVTRPATSAIPTRLQATYLPSDLHSAPIGTVYSALFGPAPGAPGSRQNPLPRPAAAPAPPVTQVLDRAWISRAPGTRRGITLIVVTGSQIVLQQELAVGGNFPLIRLGPRDVKLEASPIIDESIAIWQERLGYVVMLNSRGMQTSELQRFIANLRFYNR